MTKKLLLVDLENKQKVDLSPLDESFRAVIFVGANQNPPKESRKPATAHRFSRVDFLKKSGAGKNALDFHIAFELGRTFETAPETQCFVLSGDKGVDPLLNHLNKCVSCRRIDSINELGQSLPSPPLTLLRALTARKPAPSRITEAIGVPTAVVSPFPQSPTCCHSTSPNSSGRSIGSGTAPPL